MVLPHLAGAAELTLALLVPRATGAWRREGGRHSRIIREKNLSHKNDGACSQVTAAAALMTAARTGGAASTQRIEH